MSDHVNMARFAQARLEDSTTDWDPNEVASMRDVLAKVLESQDPHLIDTGLRGIAGKWSTHPDYEESWRK